MVKRQILSLLARRPAEPGKLIHVLAGPRRAGRTRTTIARQATSELTFGWDPDRDAHSGGCPGAANPIDDEERWRRCIPDSRIETTVSRDILLMTRVDRPAHLHDATRATGLQLCGRLERNREVEFALPRGRSRIAIEVKGGRRRPHPPGLRELSRAFRPMRSPGIGQGGVALEVFPASPLSRWLDADTVASS